MTALEFQTQISSLLPTLELFTRKFTTNEGDSKDLVQETLYKALLYKDKFKENTNLKGWLFTIMRNTFINGYRRAGKVRLSSATDGLAYSERPEMDQAPTPDSTLREKELWNIINSIKSDLKDPFLLYNEGFKYHEISEKLNIPIGTVKNRIFQARKVIRTKIEQN